MLLLPLLLQTQGRVNVVDACAKSTSLWFMRLCCQLSGIRQAPRRIAASTAGSQTRNDSWAATASGLSKMSTANNICLLSPSFLRGLPPVLQQEQLLLLLQLQLQLLLLLLLQLHAAPTAAGAQSRCQAWRLQLAAASGACDGPTS